MASKFEFDLDGLKGILHKPLDMRFRRLDGPIAEVTVGTAVLAAIRAGDLGGIDSIVGPLKRGATARALK